MASGDPAQTGSPAENKGEGSKDQEMTDEGTNNAGGKENRDEWIKAAGGKEDGAGKPDV